jgi:alpha-D-ribose 1-methylphosphonate 5-triphosphate synthase subunit PhnG
VTEIPVTDSPVTESPITESIPGDNSKKLSREQRWELLAAADADELIALADTCLAAARECTVTAPPRTGCVTAQVRDPVLRERFFLGDVLACSAEVELDGVKGWAMRLSDDRAAVLAMAICDAAGETESAAAIETQCRRVAARAREREAAEWAELAPTIVQFEEL